MFPSPQLQNFARKSFGHIDVVVPNAGVGEVAEWLSDATTPSGELKVSRYFRRFYLRPPLPVKLRRVAETQFYDDQREPRWSCVQFGLLPAAVSALLDSF